MCVSFCPSFITHLKVALGAQGLGCPLTFDLIKAALNVLTMTKLEPWSKNVKQVPASVWL